MTTLLGNGDVLGILLDGTADDSVVCLIVGSDVTTLLVNGDELGILLDGNADDSVV